MSNLLLVIDCRFTFGVCQPSEYSLLSCTHGNGWGFY
jgi:hypothetical protein